MKHYANTLAEVAAKFLILEIPLHPRHERMHEARDAAASFVAKRSPNGIPLFYKSAHEPISDHSSAPRHEYGSDHFRPHPGRRVRRVCKPNFTEPKNESEDLS